MSYSFWYHYNKPASRKFGSPKLTVHYRGQCLLVDDLDCSVRTFSRKRKTQPHVVIAGVADSLVVKNGTAYIS
jgi:hypothetical protein